jgi:CHASE2 domain-containing sensor protein
VREMATTLLDALGLLLIAAGLASAAALLIGPWPSLAVAGVVVLAGSAFAARQSRSRSEDER